MTGVVVERILHTEATGCQAPSGRQDLDPMTAQLCLLLGQPDVLKAAIHPVAGLWRVVAYLGRADLEPWQTRTSITELVQARYTLPG